MKRPNLQVVTKALVRRILFDGKRAVGVEFERGGAVERAEAEREVILSAGTVGSPHILQLSGVGAPEHLGRVGIAVHHDLPGVGQNLQDHYIARISYAVQGMATVNERSRGIPLAAEVLRYLVTGKGMLTYSASLAAASVKVLEVAATCATPDAAFDFVRTGPGRGTQEPVFVARKGARAEDDGWILSYVHDAGRDAADVVILDAQGFSDEPVATIRLPVRVPFGFHGNWLPDAA
jgi:choline dehydrogenase-like flavoprotein